MSTLQNIINEYNFKTELHAHTSPVSRCSQILAENVIRNYAEIGCDAVVITNHIDPNWLEGDPVENSERYLSDFYLASELGRKLGVNVILGVEVRFTENHNDYLVYGIEPIDIKTIMGFIDKGIREFYRCFKNDRNIILQAHPFRKNMELAPLESIDGIETFNCHPGHNSNIGFASKYARENRLIVSGGSDYHHEGHHGMCVTRSKVALHDSYDVAQMLKSRDYLFDISGSIVFPYGY